jgi:hypothetical protein
MIRRYCKCSLRPLDPLRLRIPFLSETCKCTKALLRADMWVREELNLALFRPLQCQIQRASTSL